MRIEEMNRREDYRRVLFETLSRAFARKQTCPVTVSPAGGVGQVWLEHRLLSAYTTPTPSSAVRNFLADGVRYTTRPARVIPQWIAGSAAAHPWVLRRFGTASFTTSPAICGANDLLVLPGNQRLRIFDFGRKRVLVTQKSGFSDITLRTEVTVRAGGGPFAPIVDSDMSEGWFEELLVDGWSMARCPPWWNRRKIEQLVVNALRPWLGETKRIVDAEVWARERSVAILQRLHELDERYGVGELDSWRSALETLRAVVGEADEVQVALGHGDLQAGNIMVSRDAQSVILIDWEHAGERSVGYDYCVLGFGSRSGVGLGERIRRFVRVAPAAPALREAASCGAPRRITAALFLLDEMLWYCRESLLGPYRILPDGIRSFSRSLGSIHGWLNV